MKKGWVGIFIVLFKILKPLIKVIPKALKGAKGVQVGLAAASIGGWALIFTWQFAVLIMLFLLVHEYGHVWAMKRSGMKTKGIYFIPFVGAAAVTDEMFPSRKTEVFVAIMGPAWGFVFCLVTFIAWYLTKLPLLAAVASWMALINLFNLLPITPLDGGRIFKSIAFSINSKFGFICLGLGALVAGFLAWRAGLSLLWFILILGTVDVLYEIQNIRKTKRFKIILNYLEPAILAKGKEIAYDEELESANKIRLLNLESVFGKPSLELLVDVKKTEELFKENNHPAVQLLRESYGQKPEDIARADKYLGSIVREERWGMNSLESLLSRHVPEFFMPKMSVRETVKSVLCYIAIVAVFLLVMYSTAHVSGAKEAFEVLQ